MSIIGGAKNKNTWFRVFTLLVVIAAVAAVLAIKESGTPDESLPATVSKNLPRMVDLGSDKCVQCKTMAPILEKLDSDLEGQCEIVFIDAWKTPQESKKYGIKVIPTQVFFGPDGEEFFRHEGFFSREDILNTFTQHGFTFTLD